MKRAIFFVFIALSLASCNPGTYKPLFKSKSDKITDTLRSVYVVNSKSPSSDVYRIRVYDVLSVHTVEIGQVKQGDATSSSTQEGAGQGSAASEEKGFRVEEDGNISLPVIGKVYVLNLTRKEAKDKIQEMYKVYLKDPLMDVSIIAPKVTILGEVQQQGIYPLNRENVSLVEIIGMAGGLSARANPKNLKIIRGDSADPETIYVNLENSQVLANPKVKLQNNDVIYVDSDQKIVKYEKSQSGFGIFQSILLVISTGIIVFTSFFK